MFSTLKTILVPEAARFYKPAGLCTKGQGGGSGGPRMPGSTREQTDVYHRHGFQTRIRGVYKLLRDIY